ncbi:MAG: DUF790 family protein [Proteobacteria bacterium]|nr:DUF790 family protein [Pseudomonadota bacterium]
MLTSDLVRVRRRAGRLSVPPLRPLERERLLVAAERFVALARAHVGGTRGAFTAACDEVPGEPTDYKLLKGLRKLLEDRCTFEQHAVLDPPELRRAIFAHAAAARRASSEQQPFDRETVLRAAAGALGLRAEQVEQALYADRNDQHRLVAFAALDAAALVESYELGQQQAVLLRALRVTVELRCPDAAAYRAIFGRLKFLRLLYRLERLDDGRYRLEVDGPFSLFQEVTRYGLQLALLLRALRGAGQWRLAADVRWDKDRPPLRFELESEASPERPAAPPPPPDEVARLLTDFARLESPWQAALAQEVVELPGVGLCVPDLVFTHQPSGRRVLLEVLGYWSREAVWRRIDLVRAGLTQPMLFAVSKRLRVSEQALDADLPGQLLVYAGVIKARQLAERLALYEARG